MWAERKENSDTIYYYIKKKAIKVMLQKEQRKVYISGDKLYDMFVYVYESLLTVCIEYKGGIHLHAACCKWQDKGYIITGKSGGGKTTLLSLITGLEKCTEGQILYDGKDIL